MPDSHITALVVLKGAQRVTGSEEITAAEVGAFDRAAKSISIECVSDATALLLCGDPIEEPSVQQGLFLMNTTPLSRQTMEDYRSGKMGHFSMESQ